MRVTAKWLALLALSAAAHAQATPASVLGRWRILKILPTQNVQCWDQTRARTLLGTTLTYQPHQMTWQGGSVDIHETFLRTLSRRKYQDEYSVDLPELGVAASSIQELDLQHEDADITGATTEVPGDTIVLAGPGKIIVSACGVFYTAVHIPAKAAGAH